MSLRITYCSSQPMCSFLLFNSYDFCGMTSYTVVRKYNNNSIQLFIFQIFWMFTGILCWEYFHIVLHACFMLMYLTYDNLWLVPNLLICRSVAPGERSGVHNFSFTDQATVSCLLHSIHQDVSNNVNYLYHLKEVICHIMFCKLYK